MQNTNTTLIKKMHKNVESNNRELFKSVISETIADDAIYSFAYERLNFHWPNAMSVVESLCLDIEVNVSKHAHKIVSRALKKSLTEYSTKLLLLCKQHECLFAFLHIFMIEMIPYCSHSYADQESEKTCIPIYTRSLSNRKEGGATIVETTHEIDKPTLMESFYTQYFPINLKLVAKRYGYEEAFLVSD